MKIQFLYITLIVLTCSACSQQNKYITDIEKYITNEFENRRIIMIGDYHHDLALNYQSIIQILTTWVNNLRDGETDVFELSLFLEEDDKITSLLREYMETGSLEPYLGFSLPSTTMERLEFYADLRRIKIQVDSLNKYMTSPETITFSVQGPEKYNVFDSGLIGLPREDGMRFFVEERDSLTAMNIIEYLDDNPTHKALMFFSSGHLIKNPVIKSTRGVLHDDESYGKYLGYYLKQYYGEDDVLILNQLPKERAVEWLTRQVDGNVVLLSEDIQYEEGSMSEDIFYPGHFDGFILRDEIFCPTFYLKYALSNRIVHASLKRLKALEQYHSTDTMGGRLYNEALLTLQFNSGEDFTTLQEWNDWYNLGRFNHFPDINSEAFIDQLIRYRFQITGHFQKMRELLGFGVPEEIIFTEVILESDMRAILAEYINKIKFINAIAIAMVGYPEEIIEARKYLVDYSGEKYDEPSDYLKWWRHHNYGANY